MKQEPLPLAQVTNGFFEVSIKIAARRFSFWRRAIEIEIPGGQKVWMRAGDTLTMETPFFQKPAEAK